MKTWNDVRKNLTSLTEDEKHELETLADIIAAAIRRRNELGLSQRELATKMGIQQSSLARLERIGTSPNLSTLLRMYRHLGLELKPSVSKKYT